MRSKLLFIFLSSLLFLSACTERKQEKLLNAGDERSDQGRYAEAAELYRKVIAVNPESKQALKAIYKLGFVSETYLKDHETALFNYEEFIKRGHDHVPIYEVMKRTANIYFEQYHDPDKSIAWYRRLIEFDPTSLEVDLFTLRVGQSYFRQNNFEQAREEFQQVLEKFPKSQYVPRARFEIGNSYYMEGKYPIAEEALKQVIRNFPKSEYAIEAEFLLGQCLEQTQKHEEAERTYQNLLPRYPVPGVIDYRLKELKKRMKNKK